MTPETADTRYRDCQCDRAVPEGSTRTGLAHLPGSLYVSFKGWGALTARVTRELFRSRQPRSVTRLRTHGVPATPYYDVIATMTNVNRHWVAVPAELTDGSTAVARAWTLHGDRAKALDSLYWARRIAPQLTRHPQAHETVHLLAETERRANDSLAKFARWVGVML